jgi:hypothetical protein
LHHCAQHHPLYRLGGVCLLPVAAGHDPTGKGGVAVSWTTHNLPHRPAAGLADRHRRH